MAPDSSDDYLPDAEDVIDEGETYVANKILKEVEKESPRAYHVIMFILSLAPTAFFTNLANDVGGGWGVVSALFAGLAFYYLFKIFTPQGQRPNSS